MLILTSEREVYYKQNDVPPISFTAGGEFRGMWIALRRYQRPEERCVSLLASKLPRLGLAAYIKAFVRKECEWQINSFHET